MTLVGLKVETFFLIVKSIFREYETYKGNRKILGMEIKPWYANKRKQQKPKSRCMGEKNEVKANSKLVKHNLSQMAKHSTLKWGYKTGEELYIEHLYFCSRIHFNVFKPWGKSSVLPHLPSQTTLVINYSTLLYLNKEIICPHFSC